MNGINKNYVGSEFEYHTENAILIEIVRMLKQMCEFGGVSSDGKVWQVLRANQPTVQALQECTVYFDIISKRRVGTQSSMKSVKVDGEWRSGTQWIEEWMVQVSAFRPRKMNDDENTLTSVDAITKLQACINGGGDAPMEGVNRKWLPFNWMQIIKSENLREIDFETDSGLKEKLPQFDFLLVIRQGMLAPCPKISDVEIKTEAV